MKMKHRVICFLMACIFTATTAHPFMSVDAAELWNKGTSAKKSGKSYYNKSGNTTKKGTHTLFNRKGTVVHNEKSASAYRGHNAGYGFYTEVRMSEQKVSRQWKMLSASAVRNRQADVDLALQQEYEILKDVAKKMNIATKQQQKVRVQNYKKHQKEIARYKVAAAEAELDEEVRRDRAYAKLGHKKGKSSRKVSKSSGRKSATKTRSSGLKKPTRLFNDPSD